MASSTSSDLKLELIASGEKAGTWGTITNTNLQILEQAASGYLSLDVGAANVAKLSNANATSNGKNLYYKLTGTLTGNRQVTMPDSAERVFIVEDATARSSSNYTLTVKTVSGTGVIMPVGSKMILYSDGTNISSGSLTKGYYTIPGGYTAVSGDQLLVDTSGGSGYQIGDVVGITTIGHSTGGSGTVGRNGQPTLGVAANLTVSTNGAAFTLVYVNATRGWAYKDNI